MKCLKVNLFVCVVGAVLILLLLGPAVEQAQAAPWTVVKSPSPGSSSALEAATADKSPGQTWAVGNFVALGGLIQTLTEFNR